MDHVCLSDAAKAICKQLWLATIVYYNSPDNASLRQTIKNPLTGTSVLVEYTAASIPFVVINGYMYMCDGENIQIATVKSMFVVRVDKKQTPTTTSPCSTALTAPPEFTLGFMPPVIKRAFGFYGDGNVKTTRLAQ